jgi:hypothetical protein
MNTHSYERYQELGGFLSHTRYERLLERAERDISKSEPYTSHIAMIAWISGIELDCSHDSPDERIVLYKLLRIDSYVELEAQNNPGGWSDQRVFAEVLLVVADVDSFKKLSQAHPHISFANS